MLLGQQITQHELSDQRSSCLALTVDVQQRRICIALIGRAGMEGCLRGSSRRESQKRDNRFANGGFLFLTNTTSVHS